MQFREDANTGVLLIVTAFVFFGVAVLFSFIANPRVTYNPVSPSVVRTVIYFTMFGLGSGVIVGAWVINSELKALEKNGESTLMDTNTGYFAVIGFCLFFAVISLFVIWGQVPFHGEVFFLFAGLFTYSLSRLILLVRWEIRKKKVVIRQCVSFFASHRLYIS